MSTIKITKSQLNGRVSFSSANNCALGLLVGSVLVNDSVENFLRDVQIAFDNKLSLIFNKANFSVWELIKPTNKHPRVNILQPGCKVGVHYIAVDPRYFRPTEVELLIVDASKAKTNSVGCVSITLNI